jgi:hypothetical protein
METGTSVKAGSREGTVGASEALKSREAGESPVTSRAEIGWRSMLHRVNGMDDREAGER